MSIRNRCYTSFKIVGSFDPDKVSALLGLAPDKSWRAGDLRKNGTRYDESLWQVGRCDEYDVIVENQMQKTISLLRDKIAQLNRIREENDVEFFLSIVPTVYAGDSAPCLAPSLDVIDFCHATRTQIDIDLYVCDSQES